MAFPVIMAAISGVSSIISGFFGTKQAGINAISSGANAAIDLLKSKDISEAQKEQAIAQVVAADATSESWLARNWRPLVACVLWGMVFAMFMGYNPDVFNQELSDTKMWILETAKGCLFGYMPLRSVDKWVALFFKNRMFDKILNNLTK